MLPAVHWKNVKSQRCTGTYYYEFYTSVIQEKAFRIKARVRQIVHIETESPFSILVPGFCADTDRNGVEFRTLGI